MRKIFATIIKEWKLTIRDWGGLALLFIMPMLMIIVMALVQDIPFKDYQELSIDLLIVNEDKGSLSKEIIKGFEQSKNFNVIEKIDQKPLSDSSLKQLLQSGNYHVGIIIPKGVTAEIVNTSNSVANDIAQKMGMPGTMPVREKRANNYVRVYFDPVSKPGFRNSVKFAIEKFITASCSNVLLDRLSKMSGNARQDSSTKHPQSFEKLFSGIEVKEENLSETKRDSKLINSTQHNVPSWAIFGMFFIVIPIAGHMIREREDGSATRIILIPGSKIFVSVGMIIFYSLICMLQFWTMILIGIYILPLFGLSELYLGNHVLYLIPVSFIIGFAATCYGYFIGAAFKTINQALPLGAISIVILSALGGLWVPVALLPPVMQSAAKLSPLHWALEAVNLIMLRDATFNMLLTPVLVLTIFGMVLWLMSTVLNNRRRISI